MVKLLTGNELVHGEVLWWTGTGWSPGIDDAVAVENGEALVAELAPAETVCDLALIDAERVDDRWRPVKIRERIRSYGPTVRADLAREGQDWQ